MGLTFEKSNLSIVKNVVLLLLGLYVIVYVGILKGEFFSDYLWVALGVGALAALAGRVIQRRGVLKKG